MNIKLPPQDIEAERSVLGALMLDKNAVIRVADLITARDFYKIQDIKNTPRNPGIQPVLRVNEFIYSKPKKNNCKTYSQTEIRYSKRMTHFPLL